jgi:uncharacterized protein
VELQHRFTVPASVDDTWATFMELGEVAGCFPGATVTSYDGQRFEGTCKVKLGPIALMYTGNGTFVERDDAGHRAVISASGKDKRGNGTAGATVTITLDDGGPGRTAVEVLTDLNVTGKPAQFGRGVMQDVSDKLLGQFVACLEQRFAAGEGTAEEVPTEAGVDVAAGSEAAAPAKAPTPSPAPVVPVSPPAAPSPASPPGPASPARPPSPARNVDRPAFVPTEQGKDDVLDLGATVLPVLLRSYAPYLAAAVAGLVVGVLLGRRRR